MTTYVIEIGYNPGHIAEFINGKLLQVVEEICKEPEQILAEVKRVEDHEVPVEYAYAYRTPWADQTISRHTGEDQSLQIIQCASGGGEGRSYKEMMRRAFCRLVMERMHSFGVEVNVRVV